jgi:hypothetical protein
VQTACTYLTSLIAVKKGNKKRSMPGQTFKANVGLPSSMITRSTSSGICSAKQVEKYRLPDSERIGHQALRKMQHAEVTTYQ